MTHAWCVFVACTLVGSAPGLLRLMWTVAYWRGREAGQAEAHAACSRAGHAERDR
jgi:hypothetical protein